MPSEMNEIKRDPFFNERPVIKLKHDYIISRPALAASIPDLHNRAGPVRRDESMTLVSSNCMAGAEKRVGLLSFLTTHAPRFYIVENVTFPSNYYGALE